VSVTGTNFVVAAATCYFGSDAVSGTAVSTTLVLCKSPSSGLDSKRVSVTVVQQDQLAIGSASFEYSWPPHVRRLSTEQGSERGGSLITVTGSGFVLSPLLACQFGAIATAAEWVSVSEIRCRTPQSALGVVQVKASNNGVDFGTSVPSYSFEAASTVHSINPTVGPATGNTTVVVSGQNFAFTSTLSCRFGDEVVPGTFVNASNVVCITPAQSGVVSVEVSANGVDYTSSNTVHFQYEASAPSDEAKVSPSDAAPEGATSPATVPLVLAVTPGFGSTTGGTVVTLAGSSFEASAKLACRFGAITTKASFVNRTAVRCTSPPSTAGSVEVAVSTNGVDFSLSGGLVFVFKESATVKALSPSTGSPAGETTVSITGANFFLGAAACYFGSNAVSGTAVSSTLVMCKSPSSGLNGLVSVTVAQRGQLAIGSAGFTYAWAPHVRRLSTHQGSEHGGSLVKITGSGFVNSPYLTCQFGASAIAAEWLSASQIRCITPRRAPGTVGVKASNNGIDFGTSVSSYSFTAVSSVQSVTPSSGPTSGNTTVVVTGQNFAFTSTLSCRFGTVVVPGTYVNASTVVCIAPAQNGTVSVEVSANGVDYTSSVVQFHYETDVALLSITPMSGSLVGGTQVNISGTNFVSRYGLRCRFGSVGSVSAQYVSASMVTCRSPTSPSALTVDLEFSSNEKDFTSAGITYTFTTAPEEVGSCSATSGGDVNATSEFAPLSGFTRQLAHQRVPTISMTSPTRGPITGGTSVIVVGHSFSHEARLRCYFGPDSSVLAAYINSTTMECITPSVRHASSVRVAFSNDAVALSSIDFSFYAEPQIVDANPKRGWSGDLVNVALNNALGDSTDVWCRIGDETSLAEHILAAVVACRVPARSQMYSAPQCGTSKCTENNTVRVELSLNNHDWISNDLWFAYNVEPIVQLITPTAAWGGDTLSVSGVGFAVNTPTSCYFFVPGATEATAVSATWKSSALVTCEVPDFAAQLKLPAQVGVEVHSASWTAPFGIANATSFVIDVLAEASITKLTPSSGSNLAGTIVLVDGRNFDVAMSSGGRFGWSCWFGAAKAAATVVSRRKLRCTAPAGVFAANVTSVPFALSHGIHTSRFAGGSFSRLSDPTITALSPSNGALRGDTPITLRGEGFGGSDAAIACRFSSSTLAASVIISGTRLSSTEVRCLSPAVNTTRSVRVAVSIDGGVSFTASSMPYSFNPLARVSSLSPTSVGSFQTTAVTIAGYNFVQSPELRCLFNGSALVKAKWVSATSIVCECPGSYDSVQQSVDVAVSNNGVDFSRGTNRTLAVLSVPSIVSLAPQHVAVGAPTMLTVVLDRALLEAMGTGAAGLFCRFGESTTPASIVPKQLNAVRCETPIDLKEGVNSSVEVSVDGGAHFSPHSTQKLLVQTQTGLLSFVPLSGVWQGGTRVELVVDSPSPLAAGDVFCRFGRAAPSVAVVVATGRVRCTSPSASAAVLLAGLRASGLSVQIALSISGEQGEFLPLPKALFTYHTPASTFSVTPRAGFTDGGTALVVRGTNFVQGSRLSCLFSFLASDSTAVEPVFTSAKWISRSEARCATPASPAGLLRAAVSVSNNGQDVPLSAGNPSFTFRSHIAIQSIVPAWAPTIGAVTPVVILGQGFASGAVTSCRFGSSRASSVPAIVLNASALSCIPPVHAAGRVTVSLTVSRRVVASTSMFGFYEQPSNVTLTPRTGKPAGGTLVSVTGTFPTEVLDSTTSLTLFCCFGRTSVVPATAVTNTLTTCVSPPMATRTTLRVRLIAAASLTQANSQSAAAAPSMVTQQYFSYSSAPIVVRVLPHNAPSAGGSTIRVTGSGFRQASSPHCVFAAGSGNSSVQARWISSVAVECIVPELQPGQVSLSVTHTADGAASERSNAVSFTATAPIQLASLTPSKGSPNVATRIVIRGLNFVETTLLGCRFNGTIVAATWLDNTTLTCLAPPRFYKVVISVRVSNNRVDWTAAALPFEYALLPRATQVTPRSGSVRGGTLLSITGSNFVNESMHCFFGAETHALAAYVSPTMVRCTTPLASSVGTVRVTVGTSVAEVNSVDTTSVDFTYVQAMRVLGLSPTAGSSSGGTVITLTGMHFTDSLMLACRFAFGSSAQHTSVALWLSPTLVQCVAPPLERLVDSGALHTDASVSVELSTNGHDFTSDANTFDFVAAPQVISATPARGSVVGGTRVVVRGTHLGSTSTVCRFGATSRSSPAVVVSPQEIHCITPVSRATGRVALQVSVNGGVRFAESTVSFDFVEDVRALLSHATGDAHLSVQITSITPPAASSAGGADVVVSGSGFANVPTLACRFGSTIVPATFVSDDEIRCTAPRHVPSRTSFEVTVNGATFSRSNSAFDFDLQPEVHAVYPNVGSARGGTVITVTGAHFLASAVGGALACRIGGIITPVFAHVSVNEVQCRTPPGLVVPLHTFVEVSANNFTGTSSPGGMPFAYLALPKISTMLPSSGSIAGGTEVLAQITPGVATSAWIDHAWKCRFGTTVVPATLISETGVICTAPPATRAGLVDFEITMNGQEFTFSGLTFVYEEVLLANSVWPLLAPAFAGGTAVEIRGSGIVESRDIACRFGGVVTEAIWLSANVMKCRVPAGAPGMIPVEVSNNGIDFTNSGLRLLRYPDESVTHVVPSRALWTGLVPVFVRGHNFLNTSSLACRFDTAVVRAVWISPRVVSCIVPSRVGMLINETKSVVPVDVSNNGVDFTKSQTQFEFLQACPRGDFCPALTIQPCANGTICSRPGSFNFSLCPVGSFQPRAEQSSCLACPIGYFCPESGLSRPVLCPAGYVCDTAGLILPTKPCPNGHSCASGTKSADPMDYEDLNAKTTGSTYDGYGDWDYSEPATGTHRLPWLTSTGDWSLNNETGELHFSVASRTWTTTERQSWTLYGTQTDAQASGAMRPEHPPSADPLAERPLPCPVGYFCGQGVSSPLPQSKNFSTPQKCFRGHFCPVGSSTPEGKGPCPTGWYCPSDTEAIPCPAGKYCPGVGNYKPKQCYPGTYTPLRTQSNCTLCPPGHICPEWEMTEPRICPAGFVCASRGLPQPVIECPAGHFCSAGTFIHEPLTSHDAVEAARASLLGELVSGSAAPTYQHLQTITTPLLPIKCPVGTFCLGGVAHNVTMAWLPFNRSKTISDVDFHLITDTYDTQAHTGLDRWDTGLIADRLLGRRAPQACTEGTYCRAGSPLAGGYDESADELIGSGRCFPGHYCPPGSSWPTQAPLGNFVPSKGQMTPTLCFAGTYAPLKSTVTCRVCPAGHECPSFGTYTASICPAGTFRSREDSVSCRACPQGTWSPYKGNTDVSQCEPCPSGRVCTVQSMANITQTFACPSGHVCGEATDQVRAYDHACPAGYYCHEGTASEGAYDHPCDEGHFCLRGTKAYAKTRNKCPIGSYCPSGSTRADGIDIMCPIKTTTPLGARSIKDCAIQSVNVCDKKPDRSYILRGFTYDTPHGETLTVNDGETEIVRKVMPVNLEASDSVWFNDTVEVLSACPTDIGWLQSPGELYASAAPVLVIGQNFRDTKTLRCEWSNGGEAGKSFERTVPAIFQSRTRVLCSIPALDIALLGASVASTKLRVRVANVDRTSVRWAFVNLLHQNETATSIATKNTTCSAYQAVYEGKREGETGWFAVRALSQAHVSIDLTGVPDAMTYRHDYVLAVYVTPSLCKEYACDANRGETSFEMSPCKRPIPFSPWFESEKTVKNDVLNFTITALEDVRFRVEVHIINGLYVTAAPFFVRTATVRLKAPKRSKVTIGQATVPMREFDQGMSSESATEVTDDYQFLTFYSRPLLESTTIAPLNLPPRWNRAHNGVSLETGRVLIGFNASTDHAHVHDLITDLEVGPAYWLNPLETSEKDKYREVFDEQYTDDDGLTNWVEGAEAAFALPYLPFISNCNGYDSHMTLWALMESDTCSLPPPAEFEADAIIERLVVADNLYPADWWRRKFNALPDQDLVKIVRPTSAVDELWHALQSPGDLLDSQPFAHRRRPFFEPLADHCYHELVCHYEEDLPNEGVTMRWMEAKSGTHLFYIYKNALAYSSFRAGAEAMKELYIEDEDALIPVIVNRDAASEEMPAGTECTYGCFPRSVTLVLQYYQKNVREKTLIRAEMVYETFDFNSNDTSYMLNFELQPLSYFYLIKFFAIETEVYFGLFTLIGIFSVLVTIVVYILNRIFCRTNAFFRFLPYIKVSIPALVNGFVLGVAPTLWSLFLVDIILWGNICYEIQKLVLSTASVAGANSAVKEQLTIAYWFFDWIPVSFNDLWGRSDIADAIANQEMLDFDRNNVVTVRLQRMGLAFLIIAMYHLYTGVRIFLPKRVSKRETELMLSRDKMSANEDVWHPTVWKRSNMLFTSIVLAAGSMFIVELSYWEEYFDYFYYFMFFFKVIGFFVEMAIENQLKETLLVAPLACAFSLVMGLVMFGASDFIDFLMGYILGYFMAIFERIYFGPYFGHFVDFVTGILLKLVVFARKTFRIHRRTAVEVEMLIEEKGEDARTNRDVPDIAGGDESTVEPILDYYNGYANETLGLFYQPFIILILIWFREPIKIIENYGIRKADMYIFLMFAVIILPFQLIADVFLHNVQEIVHGWKLYDYLVYTRYRFLQRETRWKGMEDSLDECIDEGMRTLDQMCFSSQFYMMVTIHCTGIMLLIFAIEIMVQHNYNMFADPLLLFLTPLLLFLLHMSKKLVVYFAMKFNVWQLKHANTAWHSTITADDEELGLPKWEELENLRGASHEQYMMNQRIASETFRHKFVDYNRAWLVEQLPKILTPRTLRRSRPFLIAQFAKILGSVRSDISSDDDSDEDGPAFGPVVVSSSTFAIAKMWWHRAKWRRSLRETVQPIIDRSRRPQCEKCLSAKQLVVDLVIPIETLGDRFLDEQERMGGAAGPLDKLAWKNFFQQHEKFHTYCQPCLAQQKEEARQKAAKKYAGDYVSESDEDEDEVRRKELQRRFGNVNISAASTALLQLWTEKARARLLRVARQGGRRGRRIAATISDDDSEDDTLGFAWARRPLHLSPASAALALRWLHAVRDRINRGETGARKSGRKKRGKKGALGSKKRRGRRK
jgi:hypothetical protein